MKRVLLTALPLLMLLSFLSFGGNHEGAGKNGRSVNPAISSVLEKISADSLRSHIGSLCSFGTRYMYADNRKKVAEWIASKFISYGIPAAKLDSFKVAGDSLHPDSVWQYNVIAELPGTAAPSEIYIIGGHHDSYAAPNPYNSAPGADDNASGVAVALEIARVIGLSGFTPSSTIRFVTFAAEELIGYVNYSGSMDMALKSFDSGEDIRLVISNDMVANSNGPDSEIIATDMQTGPNVWAGSLTRSSVETYAQINLFSGNYPTSDAYSFYDKGFPVSGFEEYGLNPYYHTVADTVGNCRMDLCYQVTRASAAILLNEQLTPVPQGIACRSGKAMVMVSWMPTSNDRISGFRIYRSEEPDTLFDVIGKAVALSTSYYDSTALAGRKYYYRVTSFDAEGFESTPSNVTFGATAPRSRELLVVKDSKGGYDNPSDDSVMNFYSEVFKDLGADISDASAEDSLDIGTLGMYRKIFWLSNAYSDQPNSSFSRRRDDILTCLRSGGQLFIAGFQPSFLIAGNNKMQKSFLPSEDIYRYYKIQKVERKPGAALNGAYPEAADYDSVWIDSLKCPNNPKGHVINVECITPTGDATLVYRFNSAYDTSTSQGKMKGKPVGLEYLGDDYKLIILSVPLYYLESADAGNLAEYISKTKFKTTTGYGEPVSPQFQNGFISCVPNPAHDQAVVTYYLPDDGKVSISMVSVSGKNIMKPENRWQTRGLNKATVSLAGISSGVYRIIIRSGRFFGSVSMIVL